ncbi:MAG: hypothetical protein KDB02_14430, partial [Acidimicrobiales bacterium]|nr:hypothetical protein [Acidimicrobiales bacterium]
PLIKVMNLISLLILPAIVNRYDTDKLLELKQSPDALAIVIAVVAAVVVFGAIAFSKKSGEAQAAVD